MSDEQQPEAVKRLTIRAILKDLMSKFFSLERGWLRTAKELCTRPGAMIRSYIEGERRVYANPIAYLLVATAISVLVQTTVGFQEWILEDTLNNPELSPKLAAFTRDIHELMFKHTLYVGLSILLPFALFLRLFFRRSGLNLAEMIVFALYTGGQMTLFGILILPIMKLFSLHPVMVGIPLTLAYNGYAAVGFFGGRVFTVIKTLLAYTLGMIGIMVTGFVSAIAYVLLFGTSLQMIDSSWNLISATELGSPAIVESLIKEGDDVDMTLQLTPLHVAADRGELEIVDLLLANGADVDAKDHANQAPLYFAIRREHLDIAWRLIEAGADPRGQTKSGSTLLMEAVRTDELDLVRWLLDNDVEVNAVLPEGNHVTALMWAAKESSVAVVQMLLEYGADPAIENDEGETALDVADSEDIADLLREAAEF